MRPMPLLLFFATFSLSSAPHPQQEAPAPLEVRFSGLLRWKNDCLRGALDIVNHSSGPLFLTSMGPYFSGSPFDVAHLSPGAMLPTKAHGTESEVVFDSPC